MLRNRLKINDSKTDMVVFASPHVKLPALSITISAESHQPAKRVRYTGATMYVHLTMKAHKKRIYQVSYFQLKTIRTVKKCCHSRPLKDHYMPL